MLSLISYERAIALVAALATAAILAPGAPAHAADAPVKIDRKVPAAFGSLSWSPDGDRLAYLRGNRPRIYSIRDKTGTSVKIPNAIFLSHDTDGSLLVLFQKGKDRMLAVVNSSGAETSRHRLDVPAEAVHRDGSAYVLRVSSSRAMKIGVNREFSLYRHDTRSGQSTLVHKQGRIQRRGADGSPPAEGWLQAPPSPLDGSVALVEHVAPPVMQTYVNIILVDPLTGLKSELYRAPSARFPGTGAWSADGTRLALADGDGHLRILNRNGDFTMVDDSISGAAPAWSPAGSRIYFGGWLINSDGSASQRVLPEARQSVALWSPGGSALALVLEGQLMLLPMADGTGYARGDRPPGEELRTKVSVLRELLAEELITQEDYSFRFQRLLKIREAAK